ncbi:type IV pili methyl-accepting chemotaxis transducer N-terminal domain-containing protein [Polaribacter marinivivus]|uniref:Type IV pili methyl-accepting chemotaxis transducer N-terminal domain-containing protein n=1 Tax=Polaribacter marinivivus TaxID=1524260 RepID=A0ABV8R5A7_9FLAO
MKKRLYFTIIVLTLLVFIDKYYIYNDLEIIKKDIEVINLAGSQRMRSQKIIKLVLYYEINKPAPFINIIFLENSINEFIISHNQLKQFHIKRYKSENLEFLYKKIEPFYNNIVNSAKTLIDDKDNIKKVNNFVKMIKLNENDYLNLMDKIVMEYEAIGQQRIAKIESRENILNTMVVLIFLNIFFMSGFEILKKKKKKKANLA